MGTHAKKNCAVAICKQTIYRQIITQRRIQFYFNTQVGNDLNVFI